MHVRHLLSANIEDKACLEVKQEVSSGTVNSLSQCKNNKCKCRVQKRFAYGRYSQKDGK